MISDSIITLRAMEMSDADAMYQWENDTTLWALGDNTTPFSHNIIRQFIETASNDIYTNKQIRLIIEFRGQAIGTADLFNFSPQYARAEIGILIYQSSHRGRGYSTRATKLLCRYAFTILKIKQLYAHVPTNNLPSIAMCRAAGFTTSGTLRQWCDDQDVAIMQCFAPDRFPPFIASFNE